jgi:hypothetical protein
MHLFSYKIMKNDSNTNYIIFTNRDRLVAQQLYNSIDVFNIFIFILFLKILNTSILLCKNHANNTSPTKIMHVRTFDYKPFIILKNWFETFNRMRFYSTAN